MPLTKRISRVVDGKRIQETVEMTAQEEADFLAEQAVNEAQQAEAKINRKRKKLIAHETQKAVDALIAPEKAAIGNMDDAALDAAIANL